MSNATLSNEDPTMSGSGRAAGTPGARRSRRGAGRVRTAGWTVASVLGLGTAMAARGAAQAARLSVRPREIANATPSGQTGDLRLDSLPGYSLYVPQSCTATRRCPLVVIASAVPAYALVMPQTLLGWQRPVADKYGLITLALAPYRAIRLDSASALEPSRAEQLDLDPRQLDAALTRVLQEHAVDPERIALVGYVSDAATETPKVVREAWPVAVQNLDVFSRVVLSAAVTKDLPLPPAPAVAARPARFLLATEVPDDDAPVAFGVAQALRREGYPAELLLSLKSGGRGVSEELDFIGRWLQESWAAPERPNSVARPLAGAEATDSLPLLTTDAISRLARFWVSFRQEPDSIWRLGRRAHLRDITLPIGNGTERPVTRLTDMVALAAQYPSVAAKLKLAGLTAAEHDAYRIALVSARIVGAFGDSAAALVGVAPASVLAQNATFLKAHRSQQKNDDASAVIPGFRIVPGGLSKYEGDTVLNPEGLRPADDNWLPSGMWQTP